MHSFFDLSAGAKVLLAVCAIVMIGEGIYLNKLAGGNVARVLDSGSTCEAVYEKWASQNPDAAAPKQLYGGPAAEVRFDAFPEAAQFKTAISEAMKGGATFAGKYAVAEWGCGSNCQNHAVIDVEKGTILAFGIPSEAGVSVSRSRPLLITNPAENMPTAADLNNTTFEELVGVMNLPREYYVIEGGEKSALVKICTQNPFEGEAI